MCIHMHGGKDCREIAAGALLFYYAYYSIIPSIFELPLETI